MRADVKNRRAPMNGWKDMALESIFQPREAARKVMRLNLPADILLQAAVAVICAGMVLAYLSVRLSPGSIDPVAAAIVRDPLIGAVIQFAVLVVVAVLSFRVGRAFGGTGDLRQAFALVVWLNVVLLLIQGVQLVVLLILPPFAALLALLAIGWTLWALSNFLCELHGFQSPFLVLGGVILTVIVLFFTVALMLAMLGLQPPGPA
jgi:hypothetical protein